MAEVSQRSWKLPGQRRKRLAWGFTITVKGKRVRKYRSEWTKADAERELLRVQTGEPSQAAPVTNGISLAQATGRYLAAKSRHKALNGMKINTAHLLRHFGADTPLADITASRISEYRTERLTKVSKKTGKLLTPAAVNRPLALLRAILRIAHEEWEVLSKVPNIRMEKEPEGRIRWLEPDEEARLLDACGRSRNKYLLPLVIVAKETGLRKGELLGLTWDRVDMSRGVLRLEVTKSGKRREVPMRQAVYDALAGLPGPHEGRVWPTIGFRWAFEYAVTAAKLNEPLHFHDLRHHFASWYIMRGGSLPSLQKILGHATMTMTLRYAHLSPDHLRDEMARTDRSGSGRDRAQAGRMSLLAGVA